MAPEEVIFGYTIKKGEIPGFIFTKDNDTHPHEDSDPCMTVDDLLVECLKVHELGLGGHQVYLSQDDEGNGYHGLYFGILWDKETVKESIKWSCTNTIDPKDKVLLG